MDEAPDSNAGYFYGRTLREYQSMFGLDLEALRGKRVLDVASGPASFAAEAADLDIEVVCCDPRYALDPVELRADGERGIEFTRLAYEHFPAPLSKRFYTDIDDTIAHGQRALDHFAADFEQHRNGRYIAASLPEIPLPSRSFDLVLCANFLILYADISPGIGVPALDYPFHLSAVEELLRLARGPVRLRPSHGIFGEPHPYADRLRVDLAGQGHQTRFVDTEYELTELTRPLLQIQPGAIRPG